MFNRGQQRWLRAVKDTARHEYLSGKPGSATRAVSGLTLFNLDLSDAVDPVRRTFHTLLPLLFQYASAPFLSLWVPARSDCRLQAGLEMLIKATLYLAYRNHPHRCALSRAHRCSCLWESTALLSGWQAESVNKRPSGPAGRLFPPFAQVFSVFLPPSSATLSCSEGSTLQKGPTLSGLCIDRHGTGNRQGKGKSSYPARWLREERRIRLTVSWDTP